jgi:hypothetical protein
MNDIPEALGTVAAGAIAARAVEPAHGEHGGHTAETACLNCGTGLSGPHCHACGQHAHVHRTLGAFFHDLLHGVFHFEGKLWRTLPLLAWHPGRLTREYIDGRRASYISPIALFLFTIFVSFALWNALGGVGEVSAIDSKLAASNGAEMSTKLRELDAQIASLEKQVAAAGPNRAKLSTELASQRRARDIMAAIAGEPATASTNPAERRAASATVNASGAPDWLSDAWRKAKADPALMLYKLQSNAYKLSWLLIPLSLPFMWLMFPFSRRFRMYDHTVFVTYSISFMTALAALASLGAFLGWAWLVIAPLLFAPVHLYRQLSGTYGLSPFGALWRMLVISAAIYLVLALFTLAMIALVIT